MKRDKFPYFILSLMTVALLYFFIKVSEIKLSEIKRRKETVREIEKKSTKTLDTNSLIFKSEEYIQTPWVPNLNYGYDGFGL
jgi:hypothetical protein